MEVDCFSYAQTGYYTELICDYLAQENSVKEFYNRYPTLANFEAQIAEKQANFPEENRSVLYDSLRQQYKNVDTSKSTLDNIIQLKEPITFTVVTGHQLNLFTGPLYFLYKIISTINLTKDLKKEYPKYNFVPIYWMATEDHDFDEINYFNFKGKKIQWAPKESKDNGGAVGVMPTAGLEDVFTIFSNALGNSTNAKALKSLFENAYIKHDTLTEATRFLANELFKDQGLVIVDGDDKGLKEELIPFVKEDIFKGTSYKTVTESVVKLQKAKEGYNVQVNPREINYFYLQQGSRERIIESDNKFKVNNTNLEFTAQELEKEINTHPERFSPNVIARPLYQEVILPNLCYIGGGGEIAYWLELKTMFAAMNITFPALLLRNSVLLVTNKEKEKVTTLNLKLSDLFLGQHQLINKKVREISNIDIDFTPQKSTLEEQFKGLYEIAKQTDVTFLNAVKAQEIKQKKGLDALEKRLLKAQKRKLKAQVMRVTELQNSLFPNQSLQERVLNFSEIYLEMGTTLIPHLIETLRPLDLEFTVLTE